MLSHHTIEQVLDARVEARAERAHMPPVVKQILMVRAEAKRKRCAEPKIVVFDQKQVLGIPAQRVLHPPPVKKARTDTVEISGPQPVGLAGIHSMVRLAINVRERAVG